MQSYAADTSLFAIVKDENESANILNNDLLPISKCAYNWKMLIIEKTVQRSVIFKKNGSSNSSNHKSQQ